MQTQDWKESVLSLYSNILSIFVAWNIRCAILKLTPFSKTDQSRNDQPDKTCQSCGAGKDSIAAVCLLPVV